MPRTESDWFYNLYWQARSYLSHMKERGDIHAKYVELAAAELADAFAKGHQGELMDSEIRKAALERAFDMFRREQDISKKDIEIFRALSGRKESGRSLSRKYKISETNVYVIKPRVGRLLNKHAERYFERAIDEEGFGSAA